MIETFLYFIFPTFVVAALGLSIIAFHFNFKKIGIYLNLFGIFLLGALLFYLWRWLDRPPLKTLGETRLWYSLFLPVLGLVVYRQIKEKWIVIYSSGMAVLFLMLNIIRPDNFDKTLMPALQSIWFVPHVIVYILAYALLGVSSLYAFIALFRFYVQKKDTFQSTIDTINSFVYTGISLLTLGLLFGALWAKEAWGHYWTWDPKETWAFITWLSYINYLHAEAKGETKAKMAVIFLAFNFVILLISWFGVNYLPTANDSVHTYGN